MRARLFQWERGSWEGQPYIILIGEDGWEGPGWEVKVTEEVPGEVKGGLGESLGMEGGWRWWLVSSYHKYCRPPKG